jgi:cysteine-rich repeat protein
MFSCAAAALAVLGACSVPSGADEAVAVESGIVDTEREIEDELEWICGNGRLDAGEACDDANRESGDGCDRACALEIGFSCSERAPTTCVETCGDGIVVGEESCDDANAVGGDGCAACQLETGYVCDHPEGGSVCRPLCGDGIVLAEAGEVCDDGNAHSGDGCSPACTPEVGYCCDPEQGYCIPHDTFVIDDAALPIADGSYDGSLDSMTCLDVPLSGPGVCNHGLVDVLRVDVGIEHPRVGELTIKLVSPAGVRTTLVSVPGYVESEDGVPFRVGTSAPLVAAAPLAFGQHLDGAVDAENMGVGLDLGSPVCLGDGRCRFLPNPGAAEGVLGLDDFRGAVAAGTWRLCVGDAWPDRVGVIDSVRMIYAAM